MTVTPEIACSMTVLSPSPRAVVASRGKRLLRLRAPAGRTHCLQHEARQPAFLYGREIGLLLELHFLLR